MPRTAAPGLVALAAAALGCRPATQVTVEVTTDIPCAGVTGAVVIVGEPLGVEGKEATGSTDACTSGDPLNRIGSIVVVPTDEKDADFGVQVMVGLDRLAEECATPDYTGCVVARRRMRFVPQTELYVRITARGACGGVRCDPAETCVAGGVCVSSEIADPRACADETFEACDEPALMTGR